MKKVIRCSWKSSLDTLADHFQSRKSRDAYVRLIYDVWGPGGQGKLYQERTDYMPVDEALEVYGDWNYSSAYTAGYAKSPDGSDSWFKIDVWIFTTDHPEMTHYDEIEELGPVGRNYAKDHPRNDENYSNVTSSENIRLKSNKNRQLLLELIEYQFSKYKDPADIDTVIDGVISDIRNSRSPKYSDLLPFASTDNDAFCDWIEDLTDQIY